MLCAWVQRRGDRDLLVGGGRKGKTRDRGEHIGNSPPKHPRKNDEKTDETKTANSEPEAEITNSEQEAEITNKGDAKAEKVKLCAIAPCAALT